jgi:hypothetical protein
MQNGKTVMDKHSPNSHKEAANYAPASIFALLDPYGADMPEAERAACIWAWDALVRGLKRWPSHAPEIDHNLERLRQAREILGEREFQKYQRKFWRRFLQ